MKQIESEGSCEVTPLITDVENQCSGASVCSAVFNICTTMVGAGIMSVPATVKVLGIIPAFVSILIIVLLVEITVDFLLTYTQHGNATTYAALMAQSFGSWGSLALQFCVMITNLGCEENGT